MVVTATWVVHEVEAYFANVVVNLTSETNAYLRSGTPLPSHTRPMADDLASIRTKEKLRAKSRAAPVKEPPRASKR